MTQHSLRDRQNTTLIAGPGSVTPTGIFPKLNYPAAREVDAVVTTLPFGGLGLILCSVIKLGWVCWFSAAHQHQPVFQQFAFQASRLLSWQTAFQQICQGKNCRLCWSGRSKSLYSTKLHTNEYLTSLLRSRPFFWGGGDGGISRKESVTWRKNKSRCAGTPIAWTGHYGIEGSLVWPLTASVVNQPYSDT